MPNKKQFVKCIHPLWEWDEANAEKAAKTWTATEWERLSYWFGSVLTFSNLQLNATEYEPQACQVYGTKVKLHEAYLCGQQATENPNPNSISNSFSLNRKNSAQTTDALSYCYFISFERKFALISSWALDGVQKWKKMLAREREKEKRHKYCEPFIEFRIV